MNCYRGGIGGMEMVNVVSVCKGRGGIGGREMVSVVSVCKGLSCYTCVLMT